MYIKQEHFCIGTVRIGEYDIRKPQTCQYILLY